MPAKTQDKKTSASLHADAKEFVPAFLQTTPSAPAKPAWGGGAVSEAVKQAGNFQPQPTAQAQHGNKRPQQSNNHKRQPNRGGGQPQQPHSWARAASKPGRGGGRKHNNNQHNASSSGDDPTWSRGKVLPIDLLSNGEGNKAVARWIADDLLALRLACMTPPSWEAASPTAECLWDDPGRVDEIRQLAQSPRTGGDVVFPPKSDKAKRGGGAGNANSSDTAPPVEDCKPIQVNDETRWKAKVFDGGRGEGSVSPDDQQDDVIRKALLILNKLSLTKFDKLSDDFINCGIGSTVESLTEAVGLIVQKAQEEQHFSSMYAGLCLKLAQTRFEGIDNVDTTNKKGKKFKKILLERCQTEFETDTSVKIRDATLNLVSEEEKEYQANLIKKHYLGHMRFIGELYKGDLISIKIMLSCLPQLLSAEKDDGANSSVEFDEEKVECFAKLMTVIGASLERQSEAMRSVGKVDASESLADCWNTVEVLAGKQSPEAEGQPKVSNRIKFMLQDLLEMKKNGWVTRRQEESAKTISQIHNEVAREERAKKSSSSNNIRNMAKGNLRRGVSSGDVRVIDKAQKPTVDKDGFVAVTSKTVNRSVSMTAFHRSQSDGGWSKYTTRGSTVMSKSEKPKLEHLSETKPYLSPEICGEKAKSILKEYFVGGDTDDAVLSIHELVGAGDEGSLERGAKVVESAILYVLEMKHEEVDKFLSVYLQCAKENKLEPSAFLRGLNDPLEFLSDIAVDAPLATPLLIRIVAELVKEKIIQFDFLLNSPEYFRTDQNAAKFGARVAKAVGEETISSSEVNEVISKLMTEEEKTRYQSVHELIESVVYDAD